MKKLLRVCLFFFALVMTASASGMHASVISSLLPTPMGSPALAAQVAMAPFHEPNQPPAHIEQAQGATNTVVSEGNVLATVIQASPATAAAHHVTAAALDPAIGVGAEMRAALCSSSASPSRNSDLTLMPLG